MSPECIRNQGSSKASDIWSLGCILYQLLMGVTPFPGKSDYLIFLKSVEAKFKCEEVGGLLLDEEAKALLRQIV